MNTGAETATGGPDATAAHSAMHDDRKRWISILAKADPKKLKAAFEDLDQVPDVKWLRRPETGMSMVRGRMGGTGRRFNMGEMTDTRSACTLASGEMGVAYIAGRDKRHAEIAAVLDALLQTPQWHGVITAAVLEPLKNLRQLAVAEHATRTATSKVDFYTMVRGENA